MCYDTLIRVPKIKRNGKCQWLFRIILINVFVLHGSNAQRPLIFILITLKMGVCVLKLLKERLENERFICCLIFVKMFWKPESSCTHRLPYKCNKAKQQNIQSFTHTYTQKLIDILTRAHTQGVCWELQFMVDDNEIVLWCTVEKIYLICGNFKSKLRAK